MDDDSPKTTTLQRKLVNTGMVINDFTHDRPEYLHAMLCQLGLPRSKTDLRSFERTSGNASMMVTAGKRFNGHEWIDSPLPYGAKPRLVLIHLCSEAVRTQNPVVDVSDGIKPFLDEMGLNMNGRSYRLFKDQMAYLACAEMRFAWHTGESVRQAHYNPIESFEAWADPFTRQASFWPDHIELAGKFFETLCEHAVPLDPRALHALQHSALAMDIYSWLAHRLCRVRTDNGQKLYWKSLKGQFGQEYGNTKDFKKAFAPALRKVLTVYPTARVRQETGGIRCFPSPPPIKKTNVSVLLPEKT